MPKRKAANARSRGWCYTINNYTAEEEAGLHGIECKYHVCGREAGESGTPHLQGYIYFKDGRTLTAVKKELPRAHLEEAKGTATQNREYCTKDGDFWETGVVPVSPKEKGVTEQERWKKIKRHAKSGHLDAIEAKVFVQNYRTLKQISVDYVSRPTDLEEPCGIWYYGESGAGKTTAARTDHGTNFYLKAPTKWWDGYQRQDVVVLDDLDPYHKALGYYVKMWADKWAFPAEVKGSSLIIRPKNFIITSQYLPADIWDDHPTVLAVRRRFKIFEIKETKKWALTWNPDDGIYTKPTKTFICDLNREEKQQDGQAQVVFDQEADSPPPVLPEEEDIHQEATSDSSFSESEDE